MRWAGYVERIRLKRKAYNILVRMSDDGSGDFNIGGQIVELVLMTKKGKVLHGMIDKLVEVGRCCGMEINVEKKKTKVMRI
jgi:hypothetical protein